MNFFEGVCALNGAIGGFEISCFVLYFLPRRTEDSFWHGILYVLGWIVPLPIIYGLSAFEWVGVGVSFGIICLLGIPLLLISQKKVSFSVSAENFTELVNQNFRQLVAASVKEDVMLDYLAHGGYEYKTEQFSTKIRSSHNSATDYSESLRRERDEVVVKTNGLCSIVGGYVYEIKFIYMYGELYEISADTAAMNKLSTEKIKRRIQQSRNGWPFYLVSCDFRQRFMARDGCCEAKITIKKR